MTRKLAVVIERKPLSLEVYYRTVICVAVGRFHVYALVGPRSERRVTYGIAHAVVTGNTVVPPLIMIVGVRQVILAVVLVNPSSFVEIFKAGHHLHGTVKLNHVVFETSAHASATATVIDIGFAVIVDKNARVDKRLHAFDVADHLEVGGRLIAYSDADLPALVPLRIARMREVEVILAVLVGTYYFYFPHPSGSDWNQTWKVGVATSKYPDREFTPMDKPMEGVGGFALIDPAVFVDDDGKAYFYYGGGGKCYGAPLKDNMVELADSLQEMTGLEDFHEASWVHKYNGKYYLSYADNHVEDGRGANRLCYAMSDSPLGPWEYKGVYLEPTGCDTSHGSIVEYNGEWYAFYHNQDLSGQGNLRSICVDKLEYNPDGTIKVVKQTKGNSDK